MLRNITAAEAALLVSATLARAAEIEPAVVFDMGGKFDKSFNEGVYNGVERFKKETGIEYREFEVTNETQREQALRRMAQRGADPVLGVGFAQADALRSEEHTSELQSLMRISYAVFCLKKKKTPQTHPL